MPVGVDSGFFFALENEHPTAIEVWQGENVITSAIVLYEIQKMLLKGHFKKWPRIISDIENYIRIVPITSQIAIRASHIAHGNGIPGLDSLILSSLIEEGCNEIYTTDADFELYRQKGLKIINLYA